MKRLSVNCAENRGRDSVSAEPASNLYGIIHPSIIRLTLPEVGVNVASVNAPN